MSVAEGLKQQGEKMGIEKGNIEGKMEIAKAMVKKGYAIEDIMLLVG